MRRIDLLDQLTSVVDIMGDRAAEDALHAETAALLDQHPDDARQARLLFRQALLADRRSEAAASEPLASLDHREQWQCPDIVVEAVLS